MHISTTQPHAIEIEAVNKTFGKRRALNRVSICVAPGEMVALIGPSGSGKSTLLRHVSGLLAGDRSSGSIRIFGREVQKNGVVSGMLARVGTWRSLLGWFSREEKRRAVNALARVGLAEYAAQRASTLSGGQQQRAAIARAMEQRARIILADEPIASLDPESARCVMECLTALNQQDGVTVLVSLHQVQFALQYCPRSIAMKEGRVVYDGPSADLTSTALRNIYGITSAEIDLDGTTPLDFGVCRQPAAFTAGA